MLEGYVPLDPKLEEYVPLDPILRGYIPLLKVYVPLQLMTLRIRISNMI